MTEMSLPWPRKGDKLFTRGSDWWHNACLNYMSDNSYLLKEGYKRGAEVLVEKAMENRSDLDALIYPVVFLYRHHLELTLKQIITNGSALLKRAEEFPYGHSLESLWQTARGIIEEVWPDGTKDDLDATEECICELDRMDSTSQSFRYSMTRQGKEPLKGLQYINVRSFAEVIDRIATLLGCCDMGISHYLESQLNCERGN